ncbi:hypothetical protein IW262DRAFT_1469686 [Armillaria fumosa]|nr:hypothetical protein IW262DRAFT_1469686 [Armillaria fumosa]
MLLPLADIMTNLNGARTFTAAYFNPEVLLSATARDPFQAISNAHRYLSAYVEALNFHHLFGSQYGLALRIEVGKLVARLPGPLRSDAWSVWAVTFNEEWQCSFVYDPSLLLPGERNYREGHPDSVPQQLLLPYHKVALPPAPVRVSTTPSPKKPTGGTVATPQQASEVPVPSPSGLQPCSTMIRTPQVLVETDMASFMATYSQKLAQAKPVSPAVEHHPGPSRPSLTLSVNIPKQARTPVSTGVAPVPVAAESEDLTLFASGVESPATAPATKKHALFSPLMDDEESDIELPPSPKRVKGMSTTVPPPHAYHALTGEPLPGALFISLADSAPPPTPFDPKGQQKVVPLSPREDPPASSSCERGPAGTKRNPHVLHQTAACCATEKAAAALKLQPHAAPPSRVHKSSKPKAVTLASPEVVKRPPVALGSRTAPSPPVDGTVYARAFDPQVNLLYHEPTSRHALEHLQLSALPIAPASLLEPTTQGRRTAVFGVHSDVGVHILHVPHSGDPAICEGLHHADHLEKDIDMLYTIILDHMVERNEVIKGLINGLDVIAACEGGTAIIDQYAEAHELVRSLIIEVGKYDSESDED